MPFGMGLGWYPNVKLGGPAFGTPASEFVPGRYVKQGVTFTTRGCNRSCPWCQVPIREGLLVEIPNFPPGHIIQDNNLLQASRNHQVKVYEMLKGQKRAAVFSGGIDARLVDDWFAHQVLDLRVEQLFLAADANGMLRPLERALAKLAFLGRKKLRDYSMVGYDGESLSAAESRMMSIWELGGMPFAQLYQPVDRFIDYPPEWKDLARNWSRPALMAARYADKKAEYELNEKQLVMF